MESVFSQEEIFDYYHKMESLADIAWWKIEKDGNSLIYSENGRKMFGLTSTKMPVEDYIKMLRPDFRDIFRIEYLNFMKSNQSFAGERKYPVIIHGEEKWVMIKQIVVKNDAVATDGVFGTLQFVPKPGSEIEYSNWKSFNNMILRQNAIFQSLFDFIHNRDQKSLVTRMLRDILDHYKADRICIFRFEKDNTRQRCIYEVSRLEDKQCITHSSSEIDPDKIDPWIDNIMSNNAVMLDDISTISEKFNVEYNFLAKHGIQSIMATPMVEAGRTWGYMGIDMVKEKRSWSYDDYQWFSSMAGIISICLDLEQTRGRVTDIDRERRRSEVLLKNVVSNLPVGVEMYDKEGLLIDINIKAMEMFGVPRKESLIGKYFHKNPNLPAEEVAEILANKQHSFLLNFGEHPSQGFFNPKHRNTHNLKVKTQKLFDSEGELSGYIFLYLDDIDSVIDERTRLRDFENLFSLISEYSKIGYVKYNFVAEEGYAIKQWYVNLNEDEKTPIKEIVGHYRMMDPADRKVLLDTLQKMKEGKETSLTKEVRIKQTSGDLAWRWLRKHIIITKYAPDEGIIEGIGLSYDITAEKQLEEVLVKARDRAETMDKLKSAFLANMSHEIRTPLNSIVGFSDLLSETDDPTEKAKFVQIIHDSSELLLQLISDILDLSKIEAGTLEFVDGNVNINTLCEDVVYAASLKAKDGVQLIFGKHLPECNIVVDRNRIRQVISNLINNAIKFTPSGSITLEYEKKGDVLEFSVTDTGVGIGKEQLPHVFERFVKLNAIIRGTGLGLAISKSIVKHYHGQIGVESEEGVGSHFWFTLPYTQTTQSDSEITASLISAIKEEHKNMDKLVLVAEDMESGYLLVSTILKKLYRTEWARNGVEAVDLYQKLHPDVILMDIRMPEMDGLEATRKIREMNKEVPIIACTAFAFDKNRIDALDAGCSDYISKPISVASLKEMIKKYIGEGNQ